MSSLIAKNTLYLTLASVGQKVFSFIYFSLIARFVGVENTGLYITALSFSSMFSVLTDLGLTPVLIREGAKENRKIEEILGNILLVKILLAGAAYGFLNLVVYLAGFGPALRELIWLSGLIMVLDAFSLSFYGALRAFQNLRFEAVGVIVGQLVIVAGGLLVLWLRLGVPFLLLAMAVGSLFNVVWGSAILWQLHQVKPRWVIAPALLKTIIRYAWPFALAGIFVKVYSYIDVIILARLLGNQAVGWYSVPSKISFAFQFIPMAFAAALYPAMSQFFVQDRVRLQAVFEKSMLYLAMLALPISFGLGVIGEILIVKVYGAAYAPSVWPLKILLASLIFAFLDFPIGSLLNACRRQITQTTVMGVAMILNVVLNFLLIPRLGVAGAAWAALAGNFVLMFLGFLRVGKIIRWPNAFFWWKMSRALLAAVLMGLAVMLAQSVFKQPLVLAGLAESAFYLGLLILLGMIIYAALLFLFRLISKEQVKEILCLIFPKSPS